MFHLLIWLKTYRKKSAFLCPSPQRQLLSSLSLNILKNYIDFLERGRGREREIVWLSPEWAHGIKPITWV